MKNLGVLTFAAAILISACDQHAIVDQMTPHAEDVFAKQLMELIENRDFAAVKERFADGIDQRAVGADSGTGRNSARSRSDFNYDGRRAAYSKLQRHDDATR